MADVNLTQQEVDYIARVVDTEVPSYLAYSNPAEYERMVQGVVDTVTNRIDSERFPNTALGVLDQNRQFSKISGPERLSPYGSAKNAPKASPLAENAVYDYVAARAAGAPPTVGGALNYANPNFSDKSNLSGWINPMIDRGAVALGIGKNVHQHGTVPGLDPAGFYTLEVEGMPSGPVPTPTPRGTSPYGIMAAIDPVAPMPVERGGLLGPASIPAAITPGPVEYGGLLGAPSMPGQAGKTGRVASNEAFDAGRFGPTPTAFKETPVAAFAPVEAPPTFDPGRFGPQVSTPTAPSSVLGRFAETQPVAQGLAGLQRGLLDQQLAMGMLPSIPSPIDPAKTGAIPNYVDPMVRSQPQVQAPTVQEVPQQPAPAPAPPSYTPQPTQPAQPALSAAQMAFNERSALGAPSPSLLGPQMARDAQRGMGARSLVGGFGGALLGGALLGPVGGLLGGMIGRSYGQRTYSPPAPERVQGQPMGTAPGGGVSYGDLNSYGQETYESSGDFRDSIDSGGVGLY